MTTLKLWQLQIKAFLRAPQWEAAVIAKIITGLFILLIFIKRIAH